MNTFIREYQNEPIKTEIVNNVQHFQYTNSLQENFKLFHINIRSISKNFDELSIYLSQFLIKFDIIVLTETYVVHDLSIFSMKGYDVLYNKGNVNKNDGVIIFIKSNIEYTHNIVNVGEVKALQLKITNQNKEILLTALYRSPSTCPFIFNNDLMKYLDQTAKSGMQILTGDINIDIMSEYDYAEEYKNILNSYGFVSFINNFTRPQSKTCLDHFFIKCATYEEEVNFKSFIFKHDITDHYPIAIVYANNPTNRKKESNKKTLYKEYINYNTLKVDLINEDWENVYKHQNVDTVAENFIKTLKQNIQKNTKKIKINNRDIIRKQWITPGLVNSINEKNDMYKKLLKDPLNETLKRNYKTCKNKLGRLIQREKKEYFASLINNSKNTSKALWDSVNSICNKSKPQTVINQVKSENIVVIDKREICNVFNKYYSELGERYANDIIKSSKINNEIFKNGNLTKNTIYLYPPNEEEIIKEINSLKPKKSPGNDNIRSEVLKQISHEIAGPLTYLVNKCFDTGSFPQCMKIGIIKPLYKTGDKEELVNYRPISLISNLAKIIEKVLKSRIVNFFNKYNILSNNQYGFREGRSTDDAIQKLTTYIYEALDRKTPSLCIFVDLSKAFDTVCHEKLLEKLKCCGIRGKAHDLITNYLYNRQQYVNIENFASDVRTVTYGVPQGTVLGPLLFTIYINSLLCLNTAGTILSFADDTAVLYKAESWPELKKKAEKDFKLIKRWFQENTLTLNCEKTKYLPFTSYSNNLPNMGPLTIDEFTKIPEAESIKYLGITIDRHLRWDLQVKNVTNKLRGLLPRFKYLKEFLDINHLKIIYYSLVQTQLSYGIVAWGGVSDCYLQNLTVVQKWILKIIFGRKITYPTQLLFNENKIFDTRQLFCLNILLKIHSRKIKITPISHSYDTRSRQNKCAMPRCEKTVGQRNCIYLAPRIYDNLPEELKNVNSSRLFKSKVKRWLLEFGRSKANSLINQNQK